MILASILASVWFKWASRTLVVRPWGFELHRLIRWFLVSYFSYVTLPEFQISRTYFDTCSRSNFACICRQNDWGIFYFILRATLTKKPPLWWLFFPFATRWTFDIIFFLNRYLTHWPTYDLSFKAKDDRVSFAL